jgi:hypothetical protein
MATVHQLYTREMHDEFGSFACWPPNETLALGDVGILRRDSFEKKTNLADLGVEFTATDPGEPADLEYSSAGEVELTGRAEVRAGGPPLSFEVTFGRKGAIFFRAVCCTWESIADLPSVERQLLDRARAGHWQPRQVVVTKLLRTGPAAVLVSSEPGARAEFRAHASVPLGSSRVVTADGEIVLGTTAGLAAKVVVPDGATPLFGAAWLRRRVNGGRQLVFRSPADAAWELADVSWTDLPDHD